MQVFSANLHLLKGVPEIRVAHFVEPDGFGVVRIDRNERDAARLIFGGELFEPLFVILRCRAVVAGEHDGKDPGVREIRGRVITSIDTGQFEIR